MTSPSKEHDEDRAARALRTRRIEAIALAVLAVLPLVPHLTFLLRTGIPRFGVIGDLALLEQATRHVWSGDTMLGPRSRFGFNHPGPLFFYFVAPTQAVFGSSTTGLHIGACLLNACAAGSLAGCARLFGRRPHAVAALGGLLLWFLAFGNATADPWSPLVIVLPLMAHLLNAAMLARGKSAALYPVALFGAIASQTHIATASTVLVITLGSVVSFLIGARRRGGLQRHERWRLAIAGAIVLIVLVPPLVEQILAPSGNIRRLYQFFVRRQAPLKPITSAVLQWTAATGWLFERIGDRALLGNEVPFTGRVDVLAHGLSMTARVVAVLHLILVAGTGLIAALRKDLVSLALLAVGAAADALAVAALQAVVGVTYEHLVFWTTAASTIAWIGVLSTMFSVIGAWIMRLPRASGVIPPIVILLGLGLTVMTASLQRYWLSKHPEPSSTHPELRTDLRSITTGLEERLRQGDAIVIVHRGPAQEIADAVVLELEKDGIDVRVTNADRDTYVGIRTGNSVTVPLHVWVSTTTAGLRTARCIELIAKSGDLMIHGSPTEVTSCP